MAKQIAMVVPVHAYGRCSGKNTATRMGNIGDTWTSNAKRFRGYAFVLAAEHGHTPGYQSEKPFVAAAAGAVPIYFGDHDLSSFMNPHRIVWWNKSTPALIKTLMHSNHLRSLPAVNQSNLLSRAQHIIPLLMAL